MARLNEANLSALSPALARFVFPIRADGNPDLKQETMTAYEVGYTGKWHLAETRDQAIPPERRGGYVDHWYAADLLELPIDSAERVLGVAERLARVRAGATDHRVPIEAAQPGLLVRLLKSLRDWLWLVVRGSCDDEPRLRFFFTAVFTVVVRACLAAISAPARSRAP